MPEVTVATKRIRSSTYEGNRVNIELKFLRDHMGREGVFVKKTAFLNLEDARDWNDQGYHPIRFAFEKHLMCKTVVFKPDTLLEIKDFSEQHRDRSF